VIRKIQLLLGIVCLLAGHRHVWQEEARIATLLERAELAAQNGDRVDAAYEGKLIAVSGVARTYEDVGDPDYVWPARFVVLERTLEGSYLEGDGEPRRETMTAIGPIRADRFYATRASVGVRELRPQQALFDELVPMTLDGQVARVEPKPGSVAVFDALSRTFIIPRDVAPDVPPLDWNGASIVSGVLRFRALRSGDDVTVVGIQRGTNIAPFAPTARDSSVRVYRGDVAPEVIRERLRDEIETTRSLSSIWMVLAALVPLGVLLTPVAIVKIVLSMGVILFFADGIRTLLASLGLLVAGWGALLLTAMLAHVSQQAWWFVAWAGSLASTLAWMGYRVGKNQDDDSVFDL
jgi:hypothetical protein